MSSDDRRTAITIGALFLLADVAGVLSQLVTSSILNASDYLAQIAMHRGQMVVGALLVLAMGFLLVMIPVVFWPVGKRYNEVLAMGYVVFRGALETLTYIIGALGWLVLVALSREPVAVAGPTAHHVKMVVDLLWNEVGVIPFVLGVLMFYLLLYQSRLVPRWLSVWGLLGAVPYIGAAITHMFGFSLGYLMAPLALQEIVLAVWLIAKGFEPVAARGDGPSK